MIDTSLGFKEMILQGIPEILPEPRPYEPTVNHAPRRKDILTTEEKRLALKNALRYFSTNHHSVLAPEFYKELTDFGHIYMYRFRPGYAMKARPLKDYPHQSLTAGAVMLMIMNNLDPAVAQHPHELITYGGNGAVFQNWAQYLLTMKYLATMTDEQTLHMYSGHPMGLFPSFKESPRIVVTNGMMIPNYSTADDLDRYNALGVTQYGQMTAGSYMYIGPQGIVHGTNITILNAGRRIASGKGNDEGLAGKLFVTSGLGGMSGAQPKAGTIAGCITLVAEVNAKAIEKRHSQGWVDEVYSDLSRVSQRLRQATGRKEVVSIAYHGNVVDLWEFLDREKIFVDLGSDQTSLHNPWAGGYFPAGLSYEDGLKMISGDPIRFRDAVQASICRQVAAIDRHTANGTYFFDYGNAFLLEASRAGAPVFGSDGVTFKYPSYVQDIMGPMCFDLGFGPFRWICTSGIPEELDFTDQLALHVLEVMNKSSAPAVRSQLEDNIRWIREAKSNKLVVGSQARILYADAEGRIKIASAFNAAVREGKIGPVVLGRDHHDVSGTDSPYRETSNIYDGSRFTADMAIHNVIGDSFRGASWVSIHNGGGVGWGEVINGGFGLLLDGSDDADRRLRMMLHFDVNNGIARRSWARNPRAVEAIQREQQRSPGLEITMAQMADEKLIDDLLR